jgi:lipoyl(octanoyl) transferase
MANDLTSAVQWTVSPGLVPYLPAVAFMEERVAAIASGKAPEFLWFLEHPPLYTAGTSADPADLLDGSQFPVFRTGRGGQFTYHGPGQRVVYAMLDLRRRGADVRAFVSMLEAIIIDALRGFDISGETRPDRVGVWIRRPELGEGKEDKIAAIGIRVRRWVTFHGLSLNVAPELASFSGIVACGIRGHGVTSLAELGRDATMKSVDNALRAAFEARLGPMRRCDPPIIGDGQTAPDASGVR